MIAKVIDIDHKGNGIVKDDGKIVFVPKTIVGDEIEFEIIKQHKKYDEGRLVKVITPSDDRNEVECPYYQICGGCNISNLSYRKQLDYKKEKIKNIFKRYLDMEIEPMIIASPLYYGYRNKITYHNNNCLGLVAINKQIIDIEKCNLVSKQVNDLYQLIKKEDLSLVEKIIIREGSNGLILSVDGEIDIEKFKNKCIVIYVNNELVYEKEKPYLMIGNIKYEISKHSFFQVNTSNIKNLYDIVLKYGDFNEQDRIIDLYCGVGSISLYVANYVKNVLGIEIVESAIEDANDNAMLNDIKNVTFRCGDVGLLIDECHNYDKVIVDPPRAGLDQHTINVLNDSKVERIVYVSCDSMTLVRDIKLLTNYQVKEITLVDMFPQTHHVESVVCLVNK